MAVTLKNDDAEDEEEDEEDEDDVLHKETKILKSEDAKRSQSEKQPTGKVVGIIKRNWRSFVSVLLISHKTFIFHQICLSHRFYFFIFLFLYIDVPPDRLCNSGV